MCGVFYSYAGVAYVEAGNDAKQDRASKYLSRRVKEYSSWRDVRHSLLQARLQEEAFSSDTMCVECCNSFAVCRCINCGPRQYFCMDCASALHEKRNYFHVLEIFKEGSFVPSMVNHAVIALEHQRKCPSAEKRNIVCIDQWGHQHQKSILFCACEKDTVTLLKLHLWPGSISRPLVAFHLNLVSLAEHFLLECHVSLKKFCDVLGLSKSTMLPKWIKDIYKILNNDSFDEFRYHEYLIKSMKEVNDQLCETICPLCPQNGNDNETQNLVIESMDGCFGLVRKKSAGTVLLPPRHGTTMFADQEHVDEFVLDYSKDAQEAPADCNEFKSGEVNNMLYDQKGEMHCLTKREYLAECVDMNTLKVSST